MSTTFYIKNKILKFFNFKPKFNYKNYKLIFSDNFKEDSDKWLKTMYYGHLHPDDLWYASEDCVEFSSEGLKLHQRFNNRTVEYWDGKTYNTILDNGYLTSIDPYGYGLYEWNVILPKGANQWPALWLTGFDSWPPEIDVVEAYSDANGKYNNRLNTNIHYGVIGDKYDISGRKSLSFKESELDEPINFKLIFEENLICIYVNNFLVRRIKNKKIMKWFNNQKFYIVMSSGMSDYNTNPNQETVFLIKNFSYYQNY
jgi:hypothetical protein